MDEQSVLKDIVLTSIKENRKTQRWAIFFRLLFWGYLFFVTFIVARLIFSENQSTTSSTQKNHIALIRLEGVIDSLNHTTNSNSIIDSLENAFKNKNSQAVILYINSPGGSAVESDIIFRAIRELSKTYPKKNIVAVAGEYAASGGYYIASACKKIYANNASIVGSIGVRFDSFGFSELMKRYGVERRLYTAGDHKDLLDPFSPSKDRDKKYLITMLNEIHKTFIASVKEGRGDRLKESEPLFDGRAWVGSQALGLGIIDEIGDYRSVAKSIDANASLIDYSPKLSVMEELASNLGIRSLVTTLNHPSPITLLP
ncbi:MAG: signal peptide peptidase SppA [Methylacidiphilales bacterium]|nr:signal peptide peptidase SppA [Candidatus Methylacidiphilales bacterium]